MKMEMEEWINNVILLQLHSISGVFWLSDQLVNAFKGSMKIKKKTTNRLTMQKEIIWLVCSKTKKRSKESRRIYSSVDGGRRKYRCIVYSIGVDVWVGRVYV